MEEGGRASASSPAGDDHQDLRSVPPQISSDPGEVTGDPQGHSSDDPADPQGPSSGDPGEATAPTDVVDRREIFKALEVVERDSTAMAESFASLFSSIRLALSEVTTSSVENMQCFSDVVGHLQESALDAATKGNRYINSCLRLNEEMKGAELLAMQLKVLRKNVEALDLAVNRVVRLPP